ncbi:MAG: MBL fold metallo-hydrolase [Bacilli bacterium]|jgi:glyoxylase-like metal-dependent hydrolase (beta-lactamase superfamily II)|nr:MBL fold metallo-hydrolase [Bacilli bacterium]MCI2111297.1 MBL fold metallo-hydrolase [Bacilli bacterium]
MALIRELTYGGEYANCYIIGEEGSPCLVIDPATNKRGCLDDYIERRHAGKCLGFLITHGHFDHIGGLVDLKHMAPVFMSEEDIACLGDPCLNGSEAFDLPVPVRVKGIEPYPVEDEDEIRLGPFVLTVIATPFHTAGSVCYYLKADRAVFTGDALFHLSVGRTDLPGGCPRFQRDSLRKLLLLPDDTKVFPGHGASTTIRQERFANPELQGL